MVTMVERDYPRRYVREQPTRRAVPNLALGGRGWPRGNRWVAAGGGGWRRVATGWQSVSRGWLRLAARRDLSDSR